MKLNNKAFAISGVLYASLILFLVLMLGTLTVMASRKVILDKEKTNIINELEGNVVTADEDTWLAGYQHRIKIVIESDFIDSDLTHFPLRIKLDALTGSDVFSKIGDAYGEIAATEAEKNSQLFIEVEKWDSATETALLYVSRDTFVISSIEDTILYFYYDHIDNTSNDIYVGKLGEAGSTPAISSVWDANFSLVNHMRTGFIDSTSYANDGTNNGTVESSTDYGVGAYFDGTDDVDFPNIFPTTYTIMAYHDPDVITAVGTIAGGSNTDHSMYLNKLTVGDYNLNAFNYNGTPQGAIAPTTRYDETNLDVYSVDHVTYNETTNNLKININGNLDASASSIAVPADSTFVLGSYDNANFYKGLIDEVWISNIVRTDAWIKAESYNMHEQLYSVIDDSNGQNWLMGYNKRQSIKIKSEHIDEDLNNFPLSIAYIPSGFNDGTCNSFVFTESDGYTPLFAELDSNKELNDVTMTGDPIFYVSSPTFVIKSSLDTYVYMYCNDESSNPYFNRNFNQEIVDDVWDENYTFVTHMSSDRESSRYHNFMGYAGGAPAIVSSEYGRAISLHGSPDILGYPNKGISAGSEITMTVAGFSNKTTANKFLQAKDMTGAGNDILALWFPNSITDLGFVAGTGGDTVADEIRPVLTSNDYTNTGFYQFTKDSTSGLMNSYLNNISLLEGTGYNQSIVEPNDTFFYVGPAFDGIIDEIWISNIKRTDAWLKAEYYSMTGSLTEAGFISQK